MAAEGLVYTAAEFLRVFVKHLRPLFKGEADRAVAAIVNGVAGRLVGEKMNEDVVAVGVFQKGDHVAVVGDRQGLLGRKSLLGQSERFFRRLGDLAHPALIVPRFDSGGVNFSDNSHSTGDFAGLGLSAAHAAQS